MVTGIRWRRRGVDRAVGFSVGGPLASKGVSRSRSDGTSGRTSLVSIAHRHIISLKTMSLLPTSRMCSLLQLIVNM
eukprot:1346775-Amorphochlora_amoeboformis.AAC.1